MTVEYTWLELALLAGPIPLFVVLTLLPVRLGRPLSKAALVPVGLIFLYTYFRTPGDMDFDALGQALLGILLLMATVAAFAFHRLAPPGGAVRRWVWRAGLLLAAAVPVYPLFYLHLVMTS